jgi:hypothetical protein
LLDNKSNRLNGQSILYVAETTELELFNGPIQMTTNDEHPETVGRKGLDSLQQS